MALFNGTDAELRAPVPDGQRPAAGKPNQALVYLVLCSATLFSIMYARAMLAAASHAGLKPIGIDLLTFKVLVEVVASYFGIGFVFAAIAYCGTSRPRPAGRRFPNFRPLVSSISVATTWTKPPSRAWRSSATAASCI